MAPKCLRSSIEGGNPCGGRVGRGSWRVFRFGSTAGIGADPFADREGSIEYAEIRVRRSAPRDKGGQQLLTTPRGQLLTTS